MAVQDRQQVTIYEVAQRVGVSIATVSRALRGTDYVAPETRRRVLAAVEELQFRPSRLGQSLAEGRHAANGIVFPDLSGPYYSEVVLGYEEVAAELGNSVLILATHGRPDPSRKVLELARRVDGMVVMGRTVADDVVAQVAEIGVPTVLLARAAVGALDTITADNDTSARQLVEHLLEHGYQRFAYLGDPDSSPDVTDRYRAFREALTDAGRKPPRSPVRCAFDVDAGHRAARRALAGSPRPQVLVCANDEVALGAMAAAAEQGLTVPADVAITGWDDVMAARYAGLTTVHQPMRELGATAARWLQDRMAGSQAAVRREVLPTRLVVRTSCGPHDAEKEVRG
ncbi:LacI family DNA-binding transcriptional regulator [Plantactinospora endophytica]|uniref:LacI family transcriptional regulator n=1 Tax=Plantactinospora endophytica TaxID=673535 RepID=A0ABQ4E0I6_9ACTN|nr:LacI family DNA-binding transcriptional regulator [Plantactinospora endophytica]GIG88206.1 LacI family transcriptional regulator [Plantactinospora endophytica]